MSNESCDCPCHTGGRCRGCKCNSKSDSLIHQVSVTNQAIQVLQSPYITNTYGGGISCQGKPTANFTPYITHARNNKDPFETFYLEPQYDARDFEGRKVEVQKNVKNWLWEEWYDTQTYINEEGEEVRAYEDGQDMTITVMEVQGDGVPDNPGSFMA